ncbi:Hypothetical protein HVR_LOCUS1174 [uncultured virus]|nr:Hypothetical protein HVR_LOCUS1174 [uncultured virus]
MGQKKHNGEDNKKSYGPDIETVNTETTSILPNIVLGDVSGSVKVLKIFDSHKLKMPPEDVSISSQLDEPEEFVFSKNKHENKIIRKKFKKSINYRCCCAVTGNPGRFSSGYCCTYPQVYRRRDVTVQNRIFCRNLDDDIQLS